MVFPYLRGFDIKHLKFKICGSILKDRNHDKWYQIKYSLRKGESFHFFAHFEE